MHPNPLEIRLICSMYPVVTFQLYQFLIVCLQLSKHFRGFAGFRFSLMLELLLRVRDSFSFLEDCHGARELCAPLLDLVHLLDVGW